MKNLIYRLGFSIYWDFLEMADQDSKNDEKVFVGGIKICSPPERIESDGFVFYEYLCKRENGNEYLEGYSMLRTIKGDYKMGGELIRGRFEVKDYLRGSGIVNHLLVYSLKR